MRLRVLVKKAIRLIRRLGGLSCYLSGVNAERNSLVLERDLLIKERQEIKNILPLLQRRFRNVVFIKADPFLILLISASFKRNSWEETELSWDWEQDIFVYSERLSEWTLWFANKMGVRMVDNETFLSLAILFVKVHGCMGSQH